MSLVSEIALKIKQKKRLGRFTVVVVLLKNCTCTVSYHACWYKVSRGRWDTSRKYSRWRWTGIDVYVVIILVPSKIVNFVQEYRVAVQQSFALHCQAEGFPEPTFTWSPCYNDCNTGTLTIPEVLNDTVYTCTATNSEGSDSADANVGKLPLNR